jgi:hypothetical protein
MSRNNNLDCGSRGEDGEPYEIALENEEDEDGDD